MVSPSAATRIVCLLLMVMLRSAQAAEPGPGGTPPPPPTVSYMVTEVTTVPVTYEFIGITEPSKIVEIRARIMGFLQSRLFKEGDRVKEGELLYQIEKESFAADVEIASARVEQAKSRLQLAESELRRVQQAGKSGAVSQSDLDKAQATQNEAHSSLRLANADLGKAQLELSYTEIHSPLTGLIGLSMKEEGSLVDTGENSLLAKVTKIDPIYVSFSVSERDYLSWRQDLAEKRIQIQTGEEMHFQVVLQDGSVYPQEGILNFEDPAFKTQTGTTRYRAEFPNPDMTLKPGQFVTGRMLGWVRPNAITVPQRSVTQIPSGAFVTVIEDGNKVDMRKVTLGQWVGNQWIIQEGLKPGERVVVDGGMKVQPGIVVNPVPVEQQITQASQP